MLAEESSHSIRDYQALPEGAPYQLVGGALVKEPSPTSMHQRVQDNIAFLLNMHVRGSATGIVIPTMDVELSEHDVFQPDLLFVVSGREHIIELNRINGAPDIVVEILSPSTGYYDLTQKKDVYESSGVREYWIVDPMRRRLEVLVNSEAGFMLHSTLDEDEIAHSSVLPDLEICGADVWV